jgi:2-keto-4-pentenoate hydratase/2-oxohepta-3-ene-1,7-dioic acid hydratase in catechol pathway
MKIICIGRNYIEHAKELNNEVPDSPVFFLKPDTAILKDNYPFYHPEFSNVVHYECEIVVKISKNGKHISENFAPKYYEEISVGIDFTARDLQQKCKEKGLPWEIAKAFDGAAPIGEFISINEFENIHNIGFHLLKNNEKVQEGNTQNMIFNINYIIAYVSKFITLRKGDLIFTGTPKGVGQVKIGDRLKAFIGKKELLNFEVK